MPEFTIYLSNKSQKFLDNLQDSIAESIFKTIKTLEKNPRSIMSKKLKGRDAYRIRSGDYRIIYEIIDNKLIIIVVAIGHRKDVYRKN